jgi:protocatechuate 3,4-dioxygenase beta subunit
MDVRNRERNGRALVESLEPRQLFAGIISGTVFSETDADGLREAHEKGVRRARVYVDTNLDGKWQSTEASALTNSKGQYSFSAAQAGLYRIRLLAPEGFRQTSPGRLYYDIATDGNDDHAANDFGLTTTAVVRGNVFDDTNADGARQVTEQGLAGVRVYIDENNNGEFDSGERSRITNRVGDWRFAGLEPGRYRIRIDSPGSVNITTPSRGFIIVELKRAQGLSNRVVGLA